jgi:serine/threonine protein phosphatase PrpC
MPAAEPEPEPEAEAEVVPDLDAFWREDVAPLQPAPAGTVIDGRYALGEVLDIQSDRILYQARDLQRCWQCGFDGNAPSEAFCARCGAALERKPEVRILEVRNAGAEAASGERVVASLVHDGHAFLVLAEPEPPPQPAAAPGTVRLVVGQRSVPGQVRDLNEDSLLILTLAPVSQSQTGPAISLFAVADGMGGHEGGEIASKLALQVLAEGIVRDIALPSLAGEAMPDDGILDRLRQTVAAANDAVYLARQKRGTDMGTTLTTLLVRDQQLFVAHVGDCRAFRWNANGLQQLTVDHSLVATMVARGQITAEEIYTHPQRSIIYRSIGDRATVEVDTSVWPLAPGDRLIACSDGLWEMLRNEGIQDGMMAEADPQAACDLLVSRANAAGGDDNISVVVVQVVKT